MTHSQKNLQNNTIVAHADGICKSYDMGNRSIQVLKDINLIIYKGDYLAIMGASGSGKSTLLNILGLLDSMDAGSYILDEQNTNNLSDKEKTYLRCHKIGFIFQNYQLFSQYNVLNNICWPMLYSRQPKRTIIGKAESLAESVGIADRLRHKPRELSGGERQRVAIARALANDPAVILADEPTGALDEKTGDGVLELFADLCSEGNSIVLVTHNPEYENRVERVVYMHDGVLSDVRT